MAPYPLSPREKQVIDLVAAAASNKQIARDLGLSIHTVKRHISRILAKLGTASRAQAAAIYRSFEPDGLRPAAPPLGSFTSRERDVIARVVLGQSNIAIASGLSVSVNTVKRHTANILDKLAVSSRIEAAALLDVPRPQLPVNEVRHHAEPAAHRF